MPNDPGILESALLRAMTLLATLRAAAEVRHSISERKEGHDPSSQETDAVASSYLIQAEDEVRTSLLQLRASIVIAQSESDDAVSANVRRFSDLTRIHNLAHILQRIHQRLLSLYPRVSEELIEEARLITNRCDALLETDAADYLEESDRFAGDAGAFCSRLRRDLRALDGKN